MLAAPRRHYRAARGALLLASSGLLAAGLLPFLLEKWPGLFWALLVLHGFAPLYGSYAWRRMQLAHREAPERIALYGRAVQFFLLALLLWSGGTWALYRAEITLIRLGMEAQG